MRAWWQGLEPRERRTLILGVVGVLLIAFYFLFWQPPREALPALRAQLDQQREDLRWMRATAAEVAQMRQNATEQPSTRANTRALYALADETARQAGLGEAITRIEPSGDNQVRVSLDNVAFDRAIVWLTGLRQRYTVTVESASIQATGEPGRVDARLVLREPAS